jgi:hypothetical protein
MIDRAHQALHLLALDPVLETNADRNSYGFRQNRSCTDAIAQCASHVLRAESVDRAMEFTALCLIHLPTACRAGECKPLCSAKRIYVG